MVKAKRNNQMTRRDKKRLEEKNSQATIKKPSSDRLPSADGIGVICKVDKEYGGRRFGCYMLNTESLNIDSLRKTWQMPDIEFESEIRAKLKGSIRNNSKSKVSIGQLVYVSYGDTIDFLYSTEETNYIMSYMAVKSKEDGDIEFNNGVDTNISFGEADSDSETGSDVDNNVAPVALVAPVAKTEEDIDIDDI